GLQRVGEADLPSLEGDRPAVGLVHAGQDLHHGGLAGPVLSHQVMHLPRMYHQVDPVQDLNSEEGLGDPLHLQDGPGRGRTHHATSTGVAACFPSTATSLTAIDREGTGTFITCQPEVTTKSNNICLTLSSRSGRGLPVTLP